MAWINDRELLNLEDARVLLRENLKTQGVMCNTNEKLSDLATKVLSVQSWNDLMNKRLKGDIVDTTFTNLGHNLFQNQQEITAFYFPNVTQLGYSNPLNGNPRCKILSLPRLGTSATGNIMSKEGLFIADLGDVGIFQGLQTTTAPNFSRLILRKSDSIATLPNTNLLTNTPFATDGGKLYVPDNLVTNYEEGTNWSSLVGMTVIGLTGSRFEALDWFEKRDGVVTLDGNEVEIIEDETVEMFKYTENLDAIYEDGVELDDDELMADHRTVTSEVE